MNSEVFNVHLETYFSMRVQRCSMTVCEAQKKVWREKRKIDFIHVSIKSISEEDFIQFIKMLLN